MPYAVERSVLRGVFPNTKPARDALQQLGKSIKTNGFPAGTIRDTAYIDRVLVPVGNNGMVIYQIANNETAKLKTVLVALGM